MDISPEVRGRDKFKKVEWLLSLLTKCLNVFPMSFRKSLFVFFRNMKSIIGIGIRYILIKSIAENCGENVSIHPGVYILSPENITIGDNVSIHPMSYIDATGGISIGSDVSIAHGTTILSSTHSYGNKSIPIKDQRIKLERTVIEDNIWIGSKATILCGIAIGHGSIIGASSVITKNVLPDSIMVGIPGKKIKNR